MTNQGVVGFPSTADGSITATKLAVPLAWGKLVSGNYYSTASQGSATTGVWTSGQLRLAPFWLPNAVSLSKIGAEVTSAGDAGSVVRLGIYGDNGNGYPGKLILDAGTIAGDSNTVQEITISQALTPGLYWIGTASQVITVTAPTLRAINTGPAYPWMTLGTSTPSSNTSIVGYTQSSVSGALPAVFQTTPSVVSGATRVFIKVA